MRGTKVRALKKIYAVMKQKDLPEGRELISFRLLKKLYVSFNSQQRRGV